MLQTIDTEDLNTFTDLVEATAEEQDIPVAQVAAALAKMLQGNTPFLLKETAAKPAAVKKSAKKMRKRPKHLFHRNKNRHRPA